jgi:hypothetical protein
LNKECSVSSNYEKSIEESISEVASFILSLNLDFIEKRGLSSKLDTSSKLYEKFKGICKKWLDEDLGLVEFETPSNQFCTFN